MSLEAQLQKLETELQKAYEEGVTIESAERLSAEFLHAQIKLANELQVKDLDTRMRKSGVKAVRAAIYLDLKSKPDVKHTEASLEHSINANEVVQGEQDALEKAETDRIRLERYYDIFLNAHIFFRGVAKGKFE